MRGKGVSMYVAYELGGAGGVVMGGLNGHAWD